MIILTRPHTIIHTFLHRYVVSPRDQERLERIAADHFPELCKACPAFMRHKDILLSPSLLRAHGIPYMQV